RKECLEVEGAHLGERGALDLPDELHEVEVAALAPRGLEELREQDVLAAPERVRLDAKEPEKARRGGADPLPEELHVVAHGRGWRRERLDDRDRQPRSAARGVDGDVSGVAEP